MKVGAASESDTRWTTEEDPRRTRFGTLMRRTSLDELPQFLNVLRRHERCGTIARERPISFKKFLQDVRRYNNRHCLIGPASPDGRRSMEVARRYHPSKNAFEFDLYYLQNWTFGLDLRIIAMTICRPESYRSAY